MEEKIIVPKYIYDKEYATQWTREVKFLEDKGINYVYAKKNDKYPVTKYKYTKTPELFLALAEFYNQVRNERIFKTIEKTAKTIKLPIEEGYISVQKDDLSEGEKKLMNITEEDVLEVVKDDTE